MLKTESVPCPACNYPIPAPTHVGEQAKCPYCNTVSEAIAQVTIPTPVFVGVIGFIVGALVGPAFWVSTEAGSQWLAKKARERLTR